MFIKLSNSDSYTREYIELSLNILNLEYLIINSLQDFKNSIQKLINENRNLCNLNQIIILKDNTTLCENIHDNLKTILNITEPSIIGYNTKAIINEQVFKSNESLIPITNSFFSFNCDNIQPNAISISIDKINQIISDNKINSINYTELFNTLLKNINFERIMIDTCFTSILYYKEFFYTKENMILSKIKKYDTINNLNKIFKDNKINDNDFLDFIKKNTESEWTASQIIKAKYKFYQSYLIILNQNVDDTLDILQSIHDKKLNIYTNKIIILNPSNNLKCKLNQIKKLLPNDNFLLFNFNYRMLKNILKNLGNNINVYIINNIKEIEFLNPNKKFNHLNQNNNVYCYSFPNYLNNAFNLEEHLVFNDDDDNEIQLNKILEFKQKLSSIVLKYFTNENIIHNIDYIKYNNKKFENIEIKLNDTILDKLYNTKNYDYIYDIIKYVLINRINFEPDIIMKTIAIIPHVNCMTTESDINEIIKLINITKIEELFNIGIIFVNEKFYNNTIDICLDFCKNNDLDKDKLMLILYLLEKSNFFNKEIDITKDVFIINILQTYLQDTYSNINNLNYIDASYNIIQLKQSLLIFLLTRINLINNVEFTNTINELISEELNFNFNDLTNESKENIINQFENNTKVFINSVINLSECMISTDDIENKRNNISKLFKILNEVYQNNPEKVIELVNSNIINFDLYGKITSVFKYSYHGIPNKELFENIMKFSKLILKYIFINISKIKNQNISNLLEKENFFDHTFENTDPKKICFISDFLGKRHSVFKDRHQVIKDLANNGYDIYVVTYGKFSYQFSRIFEGIKEQIILKNELYDIIENVNKLRSYNFDKVVFCELGMDGSTHTLANFRLGRVQFNTWGHSDTSGMEMIDYYVSSKLYELPYEESQTHYSEKLILQNSLCTSYVNPTESYVLDNPRSFYGLSKNEFIILCPQSLFKIHPDFDEYIFEILYQNPNVNMVFVDALNKKFRMYDRWDNKIKGKYSNVLSRVKFTASLSHKDFVNLIKICDFMIDPYPFGGCNTSFEAFSLDIPLVTQPSNMINGRFTYGFYQKMGFTDLIANSKEEYINLCTKLVNDKEFSQNMRKKISESKEVLFKDQETLHEWRELMNKTDL